MQNSKTNVLWLDGVLDEESLAIFLSHSPATNFFQRQLINGFAENSLTVSALGTPVERFWPFGRLIVKKNDFSLPKKNGWSAMWLY